MSAEFNASAVQDRNSRFFDGLYEELNVADSLVLQADAFVGVHELYAAIVVR